MHTGIQTSKQATIERIRAFVRENFLYMRPDFELADNDRLLERGVVDSLGVVEMVQFVEEEFGVDVGEDEISEANLGSLEAIARFVCGKQSVAQR